MQTFVVIECLSVLPCQTLPFWKTEGYLEFVCCVSCVGFHANIGQMGKVFEVLWEIICTIHTYTNVSARIVLCIGYRTQHLKLGKLGIIIYSWVISDHETAAKMIMCAIAVFLLPMINAKVIIYAFGEIKMECLGCICTYLAFICAMQTCLSS